MDARSDRQLQGTPETAAIATLARSHLARQRAKDVIPYIEAAKAAGATSLRDIASALTARGVRTPRGSGEWNASQVRAADQVTLDVEGVVDRGVGGEEPLGGGLGFETLLLPLSSSDRQMRIFDPVVLPQSTRPVDAA